MTDPRGPGNTDPPVCCGEGGTWAPKGKPLGVGCQLCPNSPTYWREGRPGGVAPDGPAAEGRTP